MEIFIVFILTALLIILFIYFNSKKIIKKTQTKLNIINTYKTSLLGILDKYKDDKDLQKKAKIEFLKKVNQELAMNIFFEKDELKIVLEELSKMELE